jgi:predicted polyphosphate/ATP-dependent NAD kinase
MKTLGLIVNPIAGLGGRVGLKGTDGADTLRQARERGAVPLAADRGERALALAVGATKLAGVSLRLLTAPGEMGEEVARRAGIEPVVIGSIRPGSTTAADTERIAREMAEIGLDLLVFVGGDGTARNVCNAVGERVPVLGIPAGVKMHSGVFAATPRAASELIVRFVREARVPCRLAEAMDLDEGAYRQGALSAKLYGYLNVLFEPGLMPGLKASNPGGDEAALAGIAADVAERAGEDAYDIVGPGTTTRAIAERLGLPKTLLGVDVYAGRRLVAADANETRLLDLLERAGARIIVTPIGGQGYLFGRGNQQISAEVIKRVGRPHIVVVATPGKLVELRGQPFLVDTSDPDIDAMLTGYVRVITGYHAEVIYPVASP